MTEILLIIQDVWVYWLIYAVCFILSITYVKMYKDKDLIEKEKKISDQIYEYNLVVEKHNKLADAYNELGDSYNKLFDYYEIAYSKYNHILYADQTYRKFCITTFIQIFYPDTKEMMFMTTRFHKSGKITSVRENGVAQ